MVLLKHFVSLINSILVRGFNPCCCCTTLDAIEDSSAVEYVIHGRCVRVGPEILPLNCKAVGFLLQNQMRMLGIDSRFPLRHLESSRFNKLTIF